MKTNKDKSTFFEDCIRFKGMSHIMNM